MLIVDDIEVVFVKGMIVLLIGMEGGYLIENLFGVLW